MQILIKICDANEKLCFKKENIMNTLLNAYFKLY